MFDELTTVFLWNDSHQEKTLVAASASSESVEVYYAVENKCSRNDTSCTVASHIWYASAGQYLVEEIAVTE
jgi:hypothetical protein